MAGHFELLNAPGGGYRVRLLDECGTVLAESVRYNNEKAAARGVMTMREIAACALIRDLTHSDSNSRGGPARKAEA